MKTQNNPSLFNGKDGHQYEILSCSKENSQFPQMSRFNVRREDGAIIDNFPAYLLHEKA